MKKTLSCLFLITNLSFLAQTPWYLSVGNTIGTNDYIGSPSGTNPLRFVVNGTERMRILGSTTGTFVGIGITNPTKALHVNGQFLFEGGGRFAFNRANNTSYENFLSFNTNGSYEWLLGMANDGSPNFRIFRSGYGQVLTLSNSGKLGISMSGTSDPYEKLHVNGNALFMQTNALSSTSSAMIIGANGYSSPSSPDYTWLADLGTGIFHPNAFSIGFSTRGFEKLSIRDDGTIFFNGNVNSNPNTNTRLAMGPATNMYYGTSYFALNAQRNLANGTWTKYTNGWKNGAGVMWGSENGDICFSPLPSSTSNGAIDEVISDANVVTYKTLQMRWNVNIGTTHKGQVMIGARDITTGPHTDFKLAVDGKLVTTDLYVTNTGWADYVFDKDYKLKKLSEVEKYIKENKHLPNVPSSKEIEATGNNIANTERILLEKVEELTLYLIEINKQVEALKNENKSLKAVLENQLK